MLFSFMVILFGFSISSMLNSRYTFETELVYCSRNLDLYGSVAYVDLPNGLIIES